MANLARSGQRTCHGTTTTSADVEVVTLDRPYTRVLVNNWSQSDSIYVTIDRDGVSTATPAVGVAGAFRIGPNGFLELDDDFSITSPASVVRVFCSTSSTPYSVSGVAIR